MYIMAVDFRIDLFLFSMFTYHRFQYCASVHCYSRLKERVLGKKAEDVRKYATISNRPLVIAYNFIISYDNSSTI